MCHHPLFALCTGSEHSRMSHSRISSITVAASISRVMADTLRSYAPSCVRDGKVKIIGLGEAHATLLCPLLKVSSLAHNRLALLSNRRVFHRFYTGGHVAVEKPGNTGCFPPHAQQPVFPVVGFVNGVAAALGF
jgi:hypothetical protein